MRIKRDTPGSVEKQVRIVLYSSSLCKIRYGIHGEIIPDKRDRRRT